jgi:para-nitrobenzyl esterase
VIPAASRSRAIRGWRCRPDALRHARSAAPLPLARALSSALADVTHDRAAALTAKVAASAGVSADLAGFSTLSEERLLEAQKSATALDAAGMGDLVAHGLALGPVIDGDLLPQSTRVSIAAGVGADKPLVLGTTDDEFTMALTAQAKALRWVPRRIVLGRLGLHGGVARRISAPMPTSLDSARPASPDVS